MLVTAVIAGLMPTLPAAAQTFLGGNWTNASSWDGGAVPKNDGTADVVFSAPGSTTNTISLPQDWNLHSVTWNANGLYNGQGSLINNASEALTLQAGFTNASGGTVTIDPDVVLGAMQTWSDTTTNSTAYNPPYTRFSGVISGSGGITKAGGGQIVLSRVNTYSGGTVIQEGDLSAYTPAALGTGAVTLNGGVLTIGGANETMAQNLKLGANGGVIESFSGQLTGSVTGTGPLTFRNGNALGATLSGVNTSTGGTTISQYSVHVTGSSSLGTGAVTLQAGGVLALEKGSNLATGQKVLLQAGSVIALQDAAVDPKSVIDAASTGGSLALVGANYTRALDLAKIGNGGLFLGSADQVVYAAATLGAGTGGVYRLGGGTNLLNASPTLTLAATNVLTGNRSLNVGSDGTAITNSAAANYTVVTLAGANNFTGGTTISGRLVVGDDHSLGSGALTLIGGALSSTKTSATIANAITAAVANGGQFSLGGANPLTLSGAVNLSGGVSEFIGGAVTLSGVISNGGLRLNSGNWTLSGNNTFSGGLTSYGTLNFSTAANLGSNANAITLSGGTLRPLNSVSLSQPVTISTYGAGIDTNGFDLTLTNQLTGGTVTKAGAGNLILKNATFGALVNVKAGALMIDNQGGSNLGGTAQINSGGSVGGIGALGSLFTSNGAKVQPGLSMPGTLTLNGNFEVGGGSILEFGLGSLLSDLIVVKGTIEKWSGALNGTITINISDAGGLAAGTSYPLIDWTSGHLQYLALSDFALGANSLPGSLSIANNRLIFLAAPEPVSSSLFMGASIICLGRRRRVG